MTCEYNMTQTKIPKGISSPTPTLAAGVSPVKPDPDVGEGIVLLVAVLKKGSGPIEESSRTALVVKD